MRAWLLEQLKALQKKGVWYWVRAVIIVSLGVWVGDSLSQSDLWLNKRRLAYRWLVTRNPRKTEARRVRIILIQDDEYWLGELAGRKPIHRDYLAKLIRATADLGPSLIALDFDLRSPSPDGHPIEHPAYEQETKQLCDTVRDIAKEKCPIVLPKTLGSWEAGGYTTDSDIYNNYDFGDASVSSGYISLPYDERLVPATPLSLKGGGALDSFARAIVKVIDPDTLKRLESKSLKLPYSDFIDPDAFKCVSAADVLLNPRSVRAQIKNWPIIIGAHWHSGAINRKEFIDLHSSPNGAMPGVILHANYVEAILDSRLYPGWPPFVIHLIEGLGAMLVALVFALETGSVVKALAVMTVGSFLVGLSVIALLFFGVIFDFFVPAVCALGHGLLEQTLEWRDAALANRR
jgi:CHASE2 domain-containing sensor protein